MATVAPFSEESFSVFLRSAVQVTAPMQSKTASDAPLVSFGAVGGMLSALAGTALNAAGRACDSIEARETHEAAVLYEGSAERAVLAEATLQAIFDHPRDPQLQEDIMSAMKDVVGRHLLSIESVAPKVLDTTTDSAFRVILELPAYSNSSSNPSDDTESHAPFQNTTKYSARLDRPADTNNQTLITNLQKALARGGDEAADSVELEGYTDVISAGVKIGGGILGTFTGLGGELASEPGPLMGYATSSQSLMKLADRALAAEAALQAVLKSNQQDLAAEGFFDRVGDNLRKLAPVVLRHSPSVLKNIQSSFVH